METLQGTLREVCWLSPALLSCPWAVQGDCPQSSTHTGLFRVPAGQRLPEKRLREIPALQRSSLRSSGLGSARSIRKLSLNLQNLGSFINSKRSH